jgi:aerobic-type carbon monoxide dehydrogenase small subunit (CoxS/CutS family)
MATYALRVNGQQSNVTVDDPFTPLLNVLQESFQLNGPRFGCGLSQCGSCTVLLDGRPIRSCSTPVSAADGHSVTSLEGLRALDNLPNPGDLHPIQQAFVSQQAIQCGYCVSGPILYGYAFVRDNANATRPEIEKALSGLLCRCCAHSRMIDAIQSYAQGGGR